MLTLDAVQKMPSSPDILVEVSITPRQRLKIRRAIERVCLSGGVQRNVLEEEIASILCETSLETEREEINKLVPITRKCRDMDTAWQKSLELKHLREDVENAERTSRRIVAILLETQNLVFNGPAVVVCAAWPNSPSSD